MKHSISFLLAMLSISSIHAQSINPAPTTEVCPNTEYTFNVTLPAAYSSLNAPGITITQQPYNFNTSNTTFNFKAKFGDVNQTQVFTVAYSGGTKDFRFTKVKSLFYGHCSPLTPNQFSINAPLCQTGNFTIDFTNVKWKNNEDASCFADITDYQYLLPSSWKLNGTTSNGTTWLSGGNPATVTSDLSTGNGQTIQVRAYNSCDNGSSIYFGTAAFIPITRASSFTLAASPNSIACGSTTPVTFTVSNPTIVTGITGYVWNLGSSSNGWKLSNGAAAPATISTTANTLLLIPTCGSALSSVFASVAAGSSSCNTNISTVSITQPAMSINGNTTFCSGTSSYSITGLPCNASVNWGISPSSGIVTSSALTSPSITLTKVGNGVVTLSTTVTSCNQTVILTKPIAVGNSTPSIIASKLSGNGEPTLWQFTATDIPGATFDWYASGTLVETNASNFFEYEFLCGVSKIIKCKAVNACGTSAFSNSIGKAGECFGNRSFIIAPNPAVIILTISVKKERKSEFNSNNLTSISEVQVIDKFGTLKKRQQYINSTNAVTIDISSLPTDTYILKVLNGGNWEEYQIIVTK